MGNLFPSGDGGFGGCSPQGELLKDFKGFSHPIGFSLGETR